MHKRIIAVLTGTLLHAQVFADCAARIPKYVELEVTACRPAAARALAAIQGQGYEANDIRSVESSAAYVSIAEALPRANVDVIDWNDNGVPRHFRGEVEVITDAESRLYVSPYPLDYCRTYLLGKRSLYAVDETFQCCRDVIVVTNGVTRKETTATCLLNLPHALWLDTAVDDLPYIGIDLPIAADTR